ncbi:MAG: transglutaminase-like domain-containing protein [Nitrososphaeria archaeon]
MVLLIGYLVLYFMTPLYIMPVIDKMQRENLRSLVSSIVKDSSNDLEKARKIYEWMINPECMKNVYREYKIDNYIVFLFKPPFVCLRLTGEKYPLWVLFSRCGACMEYALLYREIANAANLTVRSVHNPGEDHNWDEVLVGDKWMIVDASWPIFDPSPSFYEVSRGLNVSYVYAQYPNGSIIDLTKRYTNTSLVRIIVLNKNNCPIENAIVKFYSLNLNNVEREIRHLECLTDVNGSCEVRLGEGKYKIKVGKFNNLIGYFSETSLELVENDSKEVILVLHEDLMHLIMSPVVENFALKMLDVSIGFVWLFFLNLLIEMISLTLSNINGLRKLVKALER